MRQGFFSHSQTNIGKIEVISSIDNNIKKLSKKDSKFFAPTINLSQAEQAHLIKKITGRNNIETVFDLTPREFEAFNTTLIEFARKAMDNYASNFNRQHKGLNDGSDLVYFGRIEHFRKHKGTDKQVLIGNAKAGEFKPGFQSHIHLIVSRKDITQRMKLDPTTKERLTKRKIGANNYTIGFNRKNWIIRNEQSFDKVFQYHRIKSEKFEVQNIMKNGSPFDIDQLLKSGYTPPIANEFQVDLSKKKRKKSKHLKTRKL